MCLESAYCTFPHHFFFFKSRTSSGVDEWSGLDEARCIPSYPWGGCGPLLPWDLLSCCFLEQNSHQCHQGKSFLTTPLILGDLQHIHGTMNEPNPLCLQTPLPVDTSGRWHKQWPTQKGLMGWEHSPSMAQWAFPCCQSTEEPSPRKGTSCWM